jgi:hypothetical protein
MEVATENNVRLEAPKAPKKWTGLIAFSLNRGQWAALEKRFGLQAGEGQPQLKIKEFVVKEFKLNEEAVQA